jgi:hypothetical protein
MNRIGLQLIQDKKRAILATAGDMDDKDCLGVKQIEKSSITTRDLLSRLMAANMATDLPENQRLSDEDVFARASVLPWLSSRLIFNPFFLIL